MQEPLWNVRGKTCRDMRGEEENMQEHMYGNMTGGNAGTLEESMQERGRVRIVLRK